MPSGRKKIMKNRRVVGVTIDQKQYEYLVSLGDGNASRGMRRVLHLTKKIFNKTDAKAATMGVK